MNTLTSLLLYPFVLLGWLFGLVYCAFEKGVNAAAETFDD